MEPGLVPLELNLFNVALNVKFQFIVARQRAWCVVHLNPSSALSRQIGAILLISDRKVSDFVDVELGALHCWP